MSNSNKKRSYIELADTSSDDLSNTNKTKVTNKIKKEFVQPANSDTELTESEETSLESNDSALDDLTESEPEPADVSSNNKTTDGASTPNIAEDENDVVLSKEEAEQMLKELEDKTNQTNTNDDVDDEDSDEDGEQEDSDDDDSNNDSDNEDDEDIPKKPSAIKQLQKRQKETISQLDKLRNAFYTGRHTNNENDVNSAMAQQYWIEAKDRATQIGSQFISELLDNDFLLNRIASLELDQEEEEAEAEEEEEQKSSTNGTNDNDQSEPKKSPFVSKLWSKDDTEKLSIFFENDYYSTFIANLDYFESVPIQFLHFCLKMALTERQLSKQAKHDNTFVELTYGINKLKVFLANVELMLDGRRKYKILIQQYNTKEKVITPELVYFEQLMLNSAELIQTHQLYDFDYFLYGSSPQNQRKWYAQAVEEWQNTMWGKSKSKTNAQRAIELKEKISTAKSSKQRQNAFVNMQKFERSKNTDIEAILDVERRDANYNAWRPCGFVFYLLVLRYETIINVNTITNMNVIYTPNRKSQLFQQINADTEYNNMGNNRPLFSQYFIQQEEELDHTPEWMYEFDIRPFDQQYLSPLPDSQLATTALQVQNEIDQLRQQWNSANKTQITEWNKNIQSLLKTPIESVYAKHAIPVYLHIHPASNELFIAIDMFIRLLNYEGFKTDSTPIQNYAKLLKNPLKSDAIEWMKLNNMSQNDFIDTLDNPIDKKPEFREIVTADGTTPIVEIITPFNTVSSSNTLTRYSADKKADIYNRFRQIKLINDELNEGAESQYGAFSNDAFIVLDKLITKYQDEVDIVNSSNINSSLFLELLRDCVADGSDRQLQAQMELYNYIIAQKLAKIQIQERIIEYEESESRKLNEFAVFKDETIESDSKDKRVQTANAIEGFSNAILNFYNKLKDKLGSKTEVLEKLTDIFGLVASSLDQSSETTIYGNEALDVSIKLKIVLDQIEDSESAIKYLADKLKENFADTANNDQQLSSG